MTLEQRCLSLARIGVSWKTKLRKSYPEIGSQIIRSCASVGANLSEAKRAESKKDWTHKTKVSLKEADETLFWLRVIHQNIEPCENQIQEVNYLIGILVNTLSRAGKNKT